MQDSPAIPDHICRPFAGTLPAIWVQPLTWVALALAILSCSPAGAATACDKTIMMPHQEALPCHICGAHHDTRLTGRPRQLLLTNLSPLLSGAATHLGGAGGCNVDLQPCRGLPLLHAGARGRTEQPHAACGDLHQLVAGHVPAQQRLHGRQQLCHHLTLHIPSGNKHVLKTSNTHASSGWTHAKDHISPHLRIGLKARDLCLIELVLCADGQHPCLPHKSQHQVLVVLVAAAGS